MRRSNARDRERDRHRGIVACVAVSAVLAAGILAGGYTAHTRASAERKENHMLAARVEELRTGAILYVPLEGNVCRLRLIDNGTWHTRDAGTVVCDEAVSWNSTLEGQKYFVAVRVESIRAGFRR